MSEAGVDEASEFRLPTEPYPGLRPFLDHESALLFGRARQVSEVIDHLRRSQFVAVIGGSGSGKSSLIHAGVVPELRSFGIPGAGDFWIPMVCTPGTNAGEPKPGQTRSTPITRLAWKFARLLKTRGSAEADAARVEEIAALFRQDAGFARLVDGYASELAAPPGPDPLQARLLFVIDQFEELFHPTNKDSDDARLMVERVIDHFFGRHPRCYVVLTMRSEHLNDCASYLELPDAINKSSYLVRRLDEGELREAITEPAQRFLRLLQRRRARPADGAEPRALPEQVDFEPAVLERLLNDVKAITHDPDHLPLLQHLLARVWEMACRREGVGMGGVPARVTSTDLGCAVLAMPAGDAAAAVPGDGQNLLRLSLESWAEAIFRRRTDVQQRRIEALLRHLAFKDPNTGMYSQQRVNVDDPKLFDDEPAVPSDRTALWALVEDPVEGRHGQFGYVGSVDYLFWDDENPQRVTLKVSHESFIRGWRRFRMLIDKEAERFDAFIDLMQRCERWSQQCAREASPGLHALAGEAAGDERKSQRMLLQVADLDRVTDERLDRVLADPAERASWFKVLRLDRDGPRLLPFEAEVDEYIRLSRAMAQGTAKRSRWLRNGWILTGIGALLLLPFLGFSVLVQGPVKERAELFFDATALADQARLATVYDSAGDATPALHSLIDAAGKVVDGRSDGGRSGMKQWQYRFSAWVIGVARRFDVVRAQAQFVDKVAGQSEPRVNGQLRRLLTSALWAGSVPAGVVAVPAPATPRPRDCIVIADSGDGSPPGPVMAQGTLLLRGDLQGSAVQRGLFVPDARALPARAQDVVLLAAVQPPRGADCLATELVLPVPRMFNPWMLFDASTQHLLVATEDPVRQARSVTLYRIEWRATADAQPWRTELRQVAVLTNPGAYELVKRQVEAAQAADLRVAAMPTWAVPGGWLFGLGEVHWRVVSAAAEAAPAAASAPAAWLPLPAAPVGGACARLGELLRRNVQPGFVLSQPPQLFEQGLHCFEVRRGNPKRAPANPAYGDAGAGLVPAGDAEPPAGDDDVLVAVYDKPNALDLDQPGYQVPTPVASLDQFGRAPAQATEWRVGQPGPFAGWIALRNPATGLVASPWSTAALRALASSIEAEQPKPAPQALLGGRAPP